MSKIIWGFTDAHDNQKIGIELTPNENDTKCEYDIKIWVMSKVNLIYEGYVYLLLRDVVNGEIEKKISSNEIAIKGTGEWDENRKQLLCSYTYTREKETFDIGVYFTAEVRRNNGDVHMGCMGDHILKGLDRFVISYDSETSGIFINNQIKYFGKDITLTSTKPVKSEYDFIGWGEDPTGPVLYAHNSVFTQNRSVLLYAIWAPAEYSIEYDGMGGENIPETQKKIHNKDIVLSDKKPSKGDAIFVGWGIYADALVPKYQPGDIFKENKNTILYAIWEYNYVPPIIENIKLDRCESNSTLSEDGTYALVQFTWKTYKIANKVIFKYKLKDTESWIEEETEITGKEGSFEHVFGSGNLNVDNSYDIQVILIDQLGRSSFSGTIASKFYIIDFLNAGNGISFGKAATRPGFDNYLDSYFNNITKFKKEVYFNNDIFDKFNRPIRNGVAYSNSIEVDADVILEEISICDAGIPYLSGKAYVRTMFYSEKSLTADRSQIAIPINDNDQMATRYYKNGRWSEWVKYQRKNDVDPFKTLATGFGLFMADDHVVRLSEPVSKQRSGIVLKWKYYPDTTILNTDINYHFIPKENNTGFGNVLWLSTSGGGGVCTKYVYVNDEFIVGNDHNKKGKFTAGSNFVNKPNDWVLTDVFGV